MDSTQGVEAQTLANVYQAMDINHKIIPVLNKIDLPASDLDRTKKQIEDVIGIETENAIPCSGKTGEGIDEILEQIVNQLIDYLFQYFIYAFTCFARTRNSIFSFNTNHILYLFFCSI